GMLPTVMEAQSPPCVTVLVRSTTIIATRVARDRLVILMCTLLHPPKLRNGFAPCAQHFGIERENAVLRSLRRRRHDRGKAFVDIVSNWRTDARQQMPERDRITVLRFGQDRGRLKITRALVLTKIDHVQSCFEVF